MVYKYACKDCKTVWEENRKVVERDQKILCVYCKSENTERLIVKPAPAHFLGNCWSKDGYFKPKKD